MEGWLVKCEQSRKSRVDLAEQLFDRTAGRFESRLAVTAPASACLFRRPAYIPVFQLHIYIVKYTVSEIERISRETGSRDFTASLSDYKLKPEDEFHPPCIFQHSTNCAYSPVKNFTARVMTINGKLSQTIFEINAQ